MAVGMLGFFAGFIFLIFTGVFGLMKSSEPYQEAVARAKNNPQVRTGLGTPVTEGFMMSGNISTSGASGAALLDIPLSGPKGEARLYVEAKKSSGAWTYTTMEVAIPGQPSRIDLKP